MQIVAPYTDPEDPAASPLRRLSRSFGAGPIAIPALIVVVVLTIWAATEAGEPQTDWYPGALVIVALLVLAAGTLPLRLSEVPRPVLAAAGLLLAFTVWSFLSIAWADVPGDAWDGANRTLLYLLVFALMALWPQRGGAATMVVGLWIGASTVLAAVVLVKTHGGTGIDEFRGGRLSEPAGYANATAALFMMPAWPALLLATRPELGPVLRGLLGGAATLLTGVSAIALSRGSVFSVPIVLLLVLAFAPNRLRTFAVLVPVAAAVSACMPTVLDVSDKLTGPAFRAEILDPLAPTVALAALAAGVVVGIGAWVEARVERPASRRAAQRGIGGLAAVTLVAVVVGGLVVAGNPLARLSDGWHSFKGGYPEEQGQRLTQGLGSNRYDFYRVALNVFEDHPIAGVGTDNFQSHYLAQRRSGESPRYPHSIEFRTLSETGLVGAVLLLGFVVAAFFAVLQAARRAPPLAATTAIGASVTFLYWLAHGSFDWFWEFAGLGAPAFAMVGIACGLIPRTRSTRTAADRPDALGPAPSEGRGARLKVALFLTAAVSVVSMALPWLSDVQVRYAAHHWPSDPGAAYDRLGRAASLDRLSPDPYLVEGTIALRRSDQGRARTAFRRALDRDSTSAYATLELGAIASVEGNRPEALRLLRQALELDPRDPLKRDALAKVREGGNVDVDALNTAIRERAAKLR